MSETSQRVFVHVGTPKSGTTFLQASLAKNRKALRERGLLVPHGEGDLMFRAALDMRGNHKDWGRSREVVAGAWDEACRQARAYDGTSVLSHELLAGASRHRVSEAMSMLRGLEVHVLVTARDLGRQVTAEWQEGIKHGRSLPFEEFAERILGEDRDNDLGRRFRAHQDLPDVLHRWTEDVPAERVHVVCCPPPGGDPGELWSMFGAAMGIDLADLPTDSGGANATLGVDQIDLLRRINAALDGRLVQPAYGREVKQWFAQKLLAQHKSARPQLPADRYEQLRAIGESWVEEIARAGWTVHGDLQQLVPTPPEQGAPHPDETDPVAQRDDAAALLADVLVELHRKRREVGELRSERDVLKKKRSRLKARLKRLRRR